MEMVTETEEELQTQIQQQQSSTTLTAASRLVSALEQATHMAKQLPNATHPPQIQQIYSTLHSAHHHLSFFLSQRSLRPSPPQPSLLFPLPPPPTTTAVAAAAENSMSSDVGSDEPMNDMGSDSDEEVEAAGLMSSSYSNSTRIDKVEERMRDCFIRNKRLKRSASSAAEKNENYVRGGTTPFDPHARKLRSLELISQFHS